MLPRLNGPLVSMEMGGSWRDRGHMVALKSQRLGVCGDHSRVQSFMVIRTVQTTGFFFARD